MVNQEALLQHNFFIGLWHDFCAGYPMVVSQSIQPKVDIEALSISNHIVVFYCTKTEDNIIVLSKYKRYFSCGDYLIIVLAPHIKIHFFDDLSFQSIKIHIVVLPNAQCVYEQEIENNTNSLMYRQMIVTAYENTVLDYYVLYSGKGSIKHSYDSDCCEDNAQTRFRGIFCAQSNQKITIHSVQSHTHAKTQSDVLLKGFVGNNASVFYKGTITIDSNAPNTNARQEHKTLLLSDTATVESIPVLEVLNKEVQCFHASAIGMLDEAAFLYMQSRGLSIQKSRQLLLQSYLESVYHINQTYYNIHKKLALLVNSFDLL